MRMQRRRGPRLASARARTKAQSGRACAEPFLGIFRNRLTVNYPQAWLRKVGTNVWRRVYRGKWLHKGAKPSKLQPRACLCGAFFAHCRVLGRPGRAGVSVLVIWFLQLFQRGRLIHKSEPKAVENPVILFTCGPNGTGEYPRLTVFFHH